VKTLLIIYFIGLGAHLLIFLFMLIGSLILWFKDTSTKSGYTAKDGFEISLLYLLISIFWPLFYFLKGVKAFWKAA
jgi:hypothetical protein